MKYEITEEQIKETYEATSVSNQEQLKEWFPEVFEINTLNKWVVVEDKSFTFNALVYDNGEDYTYGLNHENEWSERFNIGNVNKFFHKQIRLSTDSEVLEALTNEAKKRGLKIGVFCEWPHANPIEIKEYLYKDNNLYCDKNYIIMDEYGIWAKPIKTYTKEEAEKMLNAKIV